MGALKSPGELQHFMVGAGGWPYESTGYWQAPTPCANQEGRGELSLELWRAACLIPLGWAPRKNPREPHWRTHWAGQLCGPWNSGMSHILFCTFFFLPLSPFPRYEMGFKKIDSSHSSPVSTASIFFPPWLVSNLKRLHWEKYALFFPGKIVEHIKDTAFILPNWGVNNMERSAFSAFLPKHLLPFFLLLVWCHGKGPGCQTHLDLGSNPNTIFSNGC